MAEQRNENRSMEVVKFAISIGIPLMAGAAAYGSLQNRVSTTEIGVGKLEAKVEAVDAHNQKQDVETAAFRADISRRVERIETLTEDIHNIVVGRKR